MFTLRERLCQFTEPDVAGFYLGQSLGLIPFVNSDGTPAVPFTGEIGLGFKSTFWTNNPLGNALYQMLDDMVASGILTKSDEQFCWRAPLCVWCRQPEEEHGARGQSPMGSAADRLCPVPGVTSQFFTPFPNTLPAVVTHLFDNTPFVSHSGLNLPFKVNCDALKESDWDTIAAQIASHFVFSQAFGVPRGGLPLAKALAPHRSTLMSFTGEGQKLPVLLVDDVLTTGASMKEARAKLLAEEPDRKVIGVVLFSRSVRVPDWITPVCNFHSLFCI